MRRLRRLLAALSILALFAAGCGDDGDDDDTAVAASDDATTTTTTTAAPATSTAPAPAPATLALRDTPLGRVVVDGDGMTLYLFTKDSPGTSSCEGACAQLWPPVTPEGTVTPGEGIAADEVSTITRSDGTPQVAYGGAPLYRYARDTAAGDTTGQGVGGVWFLVGADGKAVT